MNYRPTYSVLKRYNGIHLGVGDKFLLKKLFLENRASSRDSDFFIFSRYFLSTLGYSSKIIETYLRNYEAEKKRILKEKGLENISGD